MMAADVLVESSRPVPSDWRDQFASHRKTLESKNRSAEPLRDVRSASFLSMLFTNNDIGGMQLTEIRAVTDGYPLRGKLIAAGKPNTEPLRQIDSPSAGTIWLDDSSMRALGVNLGDHIDVGITSLLFEKILVEEPGGALPGIGFSGRALMHYDDLLKSELIQPGARIEYRWLLAGDQQALSTFTAWLEKRLSEHETLLSSHEGNERTQLIMERVRSYISLGSVMAVLLTGIAAMMTAARYMAGQQDRVATMRALGADQRSLLAYYLLQFGFYSLLALLLGYLIGFSAQSLIFEWLREWIDIPIKIDASAFIAGAVTALFCLLCFALPTVAGLLRTSPMRLLRSESDNTNQLNGILLFAVGFLLLMVYYSGSWQITLWVYGAILMLALIVWLVMRLLVSLIRHSLQSKNMSLPLPLDMGLLSFCRQTQQVQLRTVLLASTVALLTATWMLRNGLLDDWQSQVPKNTPNFFALDISPDIVKEFSNGLADAGIKPEPFYPVARARLIKLNGLEPQDYGLTDPGALESLGREMVLTESAKLPPGNNIVEGQWHHDKPEGKSSRSLKVSVEAEFANRLGLTLGDKLTFSFAGQQHIFIVSSFRQLDWNSMRPNFFFVLEPPGISRLPYSYMTSFLTTEANLPAVEDLSRKTPGMTLIDIGDIVERVRAILERVSLAVESIAAMTVIAGLLVVIASLRVSLRVRVQEFSIMRALGAARTTLAGSLLAELAITGLVAALTGMLTASVLVTGLGKTIFDLKLLLPLEMWLLLPVILLAVVVSVGYWVLRPVITVSPIQLWRSTV